MIVTFTSSNSIGVHDDDDDNATVVVDATVGRSDVIDAIDGTQVTNMK
jgi:hypothetical protein